MSSIKQNFDNDKKFLIDKTQEFLKDDSKFGEPLKANRSEVTEAVKKGNFSEALQKLEILREEKTGIKLTKIAGQDGESPILIRDGRDNPNNSIVLGTESFEIQYLNAIRGAIDIAEGENKPELVQKLKGEAVQFVDRFNTQNANESQENLSKKIVNEIDGVAKLLSENGVKDAHKKLNVAKDFQNFNDPHHSIVTLSKVTDKQGKKHTVIEAEVALKGLTEEQKQEYQNRADKKWFTKMPVWERKLVNKYAETIKEGKHVIPTQLRQIVGMRNAFEKITAIADDGGENFREKQHSKHAGTLASLTKDENFGQKIIRQVKQIFGMKSEESTRQQITNQNARQAQEWIGPDTTLHTNTLNSGPIGAGDDPAIVKLTRQSMEKIGGQNTNTAFNTFRLVSGANNLSGVKNYLENIADNLPAGEEFRDIKTYLKTGKKPIGNLEKVNDEKTREILKDAVNLKNDVDKADVLIRVSGDQENINLKISTSLSLLNEKINKAEGQIFSKLKEEMLTMCASGKDRTGLAMHDQTAKIVADDLGIPIDEVDKQLLKNGHTAGQAGSISAGGGTVGCNGTKDENKRAIPKSRNYLKDIVWAAAKTNKITDKKGVDKKRDAEYEKNHPQESAPKISAVKETKAISEVPKIIQTSVPQIKSSITPPPTPTATLNKQNDKGFSIN